MGRRREARELAVQCLYMLDLTSESEEAARRLFWSTQQPADEVRAFAEEIIAGVCDRREEIDRWIVRCAANWDIDRIAAVDLAVLRAGVYEIVLRDDIPHPVTINEAVEIAKRFSTEESGGFVNGVLDAVRKADSTGDDPAPAAARPAAPEDA